MKQDEVLKHKYLCVKIIIEVKRCILFHYNLTYLLTLYQSWITSKYGIIVFLNAD